MSLLSDFKINDLQGTLSLFDVYDIIINKSKNNSDKYNQLCQDIAPDNSIAILNYDAIMQRPKNNFSEEFIDWVNKFHNVEMHITRQNATPPLVSFVEDYREVELDSEIYVKPKWEFDVFNDICIKYNNIFLKPIDILILKNKNI